MLQARLLVDAAESVNVSPLVVVARPGYRRELPCLPDRGVARVATLPERGDQSEAPFGRW